MSDDHDEKIKVAKVKVADAKEVLKDATSADAKKKAGIALGEAKKELADLKKAAPAKGSSSGSSGEGKAPAKEIKYKSTTKGKFVLPGIEFMPGKSIPVPADVMETKKFKHAVSLGVLKKS